VDSPLLPALLTLAVLAGMVLVGVALHFLERPSEGEHQGWEGREDELTDLAEQHSEVRRITEATARLRREQPPRGDR
jgi:hypothetical protein